MRRGVPSEALTSPALLSQGGEEGEKRIQKFFFPSLPLGERGQGSEGFGGQTAPVYIAVPYRARTLSSLSGTKL